MNRFLLVLSSNLLLTGLAHAQIGVRTGANVLGMHTKVSANATRTMTNSQIGYQLGAYYQQKLTQRLALVPEVQFSREQAKVKLERYSSVPTWQGDPVTLQTTQGNYQLTLSYINVPVLLRFALGPIYFEAGPQASLLVGGQGEGQVTYLIGGDVIVPNEIKQAATDRFRRFDAGACAGVGISLPAGLGLSLRAYQGFVALDKDFSDTDYAIPYLDSKTRRQTLQASLTYQLPGRL